MKKNRLFMMGMAALLLSFGLILAGCATDADDEDGGGEISKLLGKWVKAGNSSHYWKFEDEGGRMGITASPAGTAVLGVKSYDGTTLTFNDGTTCSAKIDGNVLTISGYENSMLDGQFTKEGTGNNPGNDNPGGGGNNLLNGNSFTAMGVAGNEWTLTFTSATEWRHVHLEGSQEVDTGTYTFTTTAVTFSPAINGVTTGTLNTRGSPKVRSINIGNREYYVDN